MFNKECKVEWFELSSLEHLISPAVVLCLLGGKSCVLSGSPWVISKQTSKTVNLF